MNRNKKILFSLCVMAVPIIIYFFFLQWKTNTVYGDDLYVFRDLLKNSSISKIINSTATNGKFRPVAAFSLKFIFELFHKNLNGYYLFNVLIQTLNTYLVALLLNLFLRSHFASLSFSLIYGLSRFSLYDFVDIFNGGALEGLAMLFFILSVYFILTGLVRTSEPTRRLQKAFLLSVLFANLAMYTHERYIVLFPFIVVVLFFSPGLHPLPLKHKFSLSLLACLSIVLNIVLKKFAYSMPFFVGTGGTNISFSLTSAASFFADGVLSIFKMNSGPSYLTGVPFISLQGINLFITLLAIFGSVEILLLFLMRIPKVFAQKDEVQKSNYYTAFFLAVLFTFCLIPVVVTIRLEQRWLQASFSIFLLVLVIAFNSLQFRNIYVKNAFFSLYILVFLWSDYNYLNQGAELLYMKDAERTAAIFGNAVKTGTIRPGTANLFIWEKHRDINAETGLSWTLADGYFFDFYQNKGKTLIFIDSQSLHTNDISNNPLGRFSANSTQVLYVNERVTDITTDYLKDTLNAFSNKVK